MVLAATPPGVCDPAGQDNYFPQSVETSMEDPAKIARLLGDVFAGRSDVVAEYWNKSGKSGYSPICKNKWSALCELKTKGSRACHGCANRLLEPMSNNLLLSHTKGEITLGIYPLLCDGTCSFIAADFDRHNPGDPDPHQDVVNFVETCSVQGFEPYVLRSKSGKGFHVYLFFFDPVPAWKARTVVAALLEEAGILGPDAGPSSFDRLFPTQDSLSGQGFGNLIALPFQGKAMKSGDTIFLDPQTDFKCPFDDQLEILGGLKKTNEGRLDEIISDWGLKKISKPAVFEEFLPEARAFEAPDFDVIRKSCKFVKYCCEISENLSEPCWYAFLTIVARCQDGRSLAHEYSRPYPKYDFDETENKINHALLDSGPYLCRTISQKIAPSICRGCDFENDPGSPISFGNIKIEKDL